MGSFREIPFLHFELCYYQAIDYAIKNQLLKVEAGAQGEHKIARGYLPELTYSNHWFDSTELDRAIYSYLKEESKKIIETINFEKHIHHLRANSNVFFSFDSKFISNSLFFLS